MLPLGSRVVLAHLLVSTVAFVVAMVHLYRLAHDDVGPTSSWASRTEPAQSVVAGRESTHLAQGDVNFTETSRPGGEVLGREECCVMAVSDRAPVSGRSTAPGPARPERPHAVGRPSARAQRELILALVLLLFYGFFRQDPLWNENSRYDLVLALVDDRTTVIDPYHQNTGDKAFYDGHYYSDKPPGSAFLGAPVYAAMRAASALLGIGQLDQFGVIQTLAFAVSGVPSVVLAVLLLRLLRSLVDEWWALTITLGYAVGTIAFPFATMFFGHAAATFFLFAAFYVLWQAGAGCSVWPPILAGALAGWAVLVDFATALGLGILLVYALTIDRRAPLLMAVGGLPTALVLLGYNWASFGAPFSLGYANLANGGFAAGMSRGLLGVTEPRLESLYEILFGGRGLLRLSPWLALAPLGLWAARRRDRRPVVLVAAATCLAFLLFNAGYFLPFGGRTPGPRFLTPALPFAAILVALTPTSRIVTAALIALSSLLVSAATATVPSAAEGVADPLVETWVPLLLGRSLADTNGWLRWGLSGLQPLLVLLAATAMAGVALWATSRAGTTARAVARLGIGALAACVLAFGIPVGLVSRLAPEPAERIGDPGAADSGAGIAVVDVGVSFANLDGERRQFVPWAQLENRGPALGPTRVTFTVRGPSGEEAWVAGHDDVRWRAGERKRLHVERTAADAQPGDYRVGVQVSSVARGTVLESRDAAERIRIGP